MCFVVILLALALVSADARTRRYRRVRSYPVVLQPFLLARTTIHAIVSAPIRIARDLAEEDAPVYRGRPIRPAERADYSQPMRVAYVTSRQRPVAAPDDQSDDDRDGGIEHPVSRAEQMLDDSPRFESRGARPMVSGSRAVLRNGIASAPARAPQSVKNAIWAANTLRRKPYVWGGGHGSFQDRGYDCSGTVSFALHSAGALGTPLPSSDFMRYGERGRGRWITIYSRNGHTFATIAGLRLDTTDFNRGGNTGPRWHADMRDTGGYVARHPAGM
jgi:cell wall-associated NlpC family hydrolase